MTPKFNTGRPRPVSDCAPRRTRNALILCLDDDRDMLNIYSGMIQHAGHEFVGTTDEVEALSILRADDVLSKFTQSSA